MTRHDNLDFLVMRRFLYTCYNSKTLVFNTNFGKQLWIKATRKCDATAITDVECSIFSAIDFTVNMSMMWCSRSHYTFFPLLELLTFLIFNSNLESVSFYFFPFFSNSWTSWVYFWLEDAFTELNWNSN